MPKINLQVVVSAQDKASKVLTKFGKNVNKMRAGLNKYKGAILAGTAALGGLLYAAKKAIDAFGVEERAIARLTAGLRNVDGMTQRHTDSLVKYAGQLQKATTFGDEQIISSMGMLSTFQLNDKAIKALTPRLLDMTAALEKSTGQQQDMEAVAIAVGKAMTLGVGSLTRYGVVISDTAKAAFLLADAEGKVNIITQELDKNFKGIAEEVALTTTGKMIQLTNALSDLQETMGGAIAEALRPWIDNIVQITKDEKKMAEITTNVKIAIDTIIGSIKMSIDWFTKFALALGYPVRKGIELLNVLSEINAAILKIMAAPIALPAMGFKKFKGWLGFQHGGVVPGAIGQPVPAIVHGGETITPPGKAGAGITVNINGGTYLSEDAAEQIGNKIIEKLKRQIKL